MESILSNIGHKDDEAQARTLLLLNFYQKNFLLQHSDMPAFRVRHSVLMTTCIKHVAFLQMCNTENIYTGNLSV